MYARAERPPAHAARVVLAATRPHPAASIAESVLPGLKPYHPNHRMTPPTAAIVMSWPGIAPPPLPFVLRGAGRGPPPFSLIFRQSRSPSAMAPASATNPPMV